MVGTMQVEMTGTEGLMLDSFDHTWTSAEDTPTAPHFNLRSFLATKKRLPDRNFQLGVDSREQNMQYTNSATTTNTTTTNNDKNLPGKLALIQTEGWLPFHSISSSRWHRHTTQPWHTFGMATGYPSNDDPMDQLQSDAQREHQTVFEELSLKGAEMVAKMGVPERAKRAMLAEAVEDRIFELTDVLESLLEKDGSVAVENREKVQETAMLTKKLQQQYSDLVSGNPSSILTVLDSMADASNES